jgi:TolB-like protein/Tfp pilus assembly protein PilF
MAPANLQSQTATSRFLRYGALAVSIASVLVLALALQHWRARSRAVPQIQAIVVLPLRNVSGDSTQQYLADGMTEKLISNLGQISALRVISRTSSMSLSSDNNNFPEIARKLGIDGVVDGSVVREGNQLRIVAELTDAKTGRHLWKNEYVRDLGSALDLQREVAREIAGQIRIKITPQEQARLTTAQPINLEAQELYFQGRYFLNRGHSDKEAIGYFEGAIEKDPSFAPAYAGVAAGYNSLGQAGLLNYVEAYSKAKVAAKKAIEMNDDLADAHAALADAIIDLDWDWTAAGNEFRRALALNPNSAGTHIAYARQLAKLGRYPEAISEAERGLQLDPISLLAYHILAYSYYGARQYDMALDQIRKASELNLVPPDSWIHWTLGVIYRDKGNYEKAIEEFHILGDSPHVLGHMGNAYAKAGQLSEARQTIPKLEDHVQKHGVGMYEIALVYAGLGEKDEAFAWLEKAYKIHDKGLTYLKMDPAVDPLRSDPRFQSLLERVGLASQKGFGLGLSSAVNRPPDHFDRLELAQ